MNELEKVLCLEGWSCTAGKIAFETTSSVGGDLLVRRRYGWRENDGCVGFDIQMVGFDGGWLGARTCAVGARG